MKILKFLPLSLAIVTGTFRSQAIEGKMTLTQRDGKVVEVAIGDRMGSTCFYHKGENPYYIFVVFSGYIDEDENGNPQGIPDPETGESGVIWFEAPVASMKTIKFSGDLLGVSEVTQSAISVWPEEGRIVLSGVDKPMEVSVTTTSGLTVMRGIYAGDTVIDLTHFGNGVYIVKAGDHSFKMLVKQ